MKKICLIIIMILLVGCQRQDQDEIDKTAELINNPETFTPEPTPTPYVDNNPIKVGIYKDGKLLTEYNKKFTSQTDIAIFNIVFTNDEKLPSGSFKNIWKSYYDKYDNIDEYKIGFEIDVEINGEKQENIMLDPSNQHKIYPYLYAYLYDDIHNSGSYSHVTMETIKDNTIYSSIKLYLHKQTNEITSPITLTVFTYKDDNDFLDGHYRGNSKYTITIYNK